MRVKKFIASSFLNHISKNSSVNIENRSKIESLFQSSLELKNDHKELKLLNLELRNRIEQLLELMRKPKELPRVITLADDLVIVRIRWGCYLAVDPNNFDQLVGLLVEGQWEPGTTRVIMDLIKPNSTYINLGTSYGYYANLFAIFGGSASKTICVEANPYMVLYLMKSAFWSGTVNQMRIYNLAATEFTGDTLQIAFMPQFAGGGALNGSPEISIAGIHETRWTIDSLKKITNEEGLVIPQTGLYTSHKVNSVKLDDLVPDSEIDFVKMDIEGSEPSAILGCKKLICRSKDIKIICEHSSQFASNNYAKTIEAFEFLMEENFECYYIKPTEKFEEPSNLVRLYTIEDWLGAKHGDYLFIRPQ